jgi:hypothetical protein
MLFDADADGLEKRRMTLAHFCSTAFGAFLLRSRVAEYNLVLLAIFRTIVRTINQADIYGRLQLRQPGLSIEPSSISAVPGSSRCLHRQRVRVRDSAQFAKAAAALGLAAQNVRALRRGTARIR